MADTTWTKDDGAVLTTPKDNRLKYIVGGVLLLAAIVYLVLNAMTGNTQLYKTVEEFYAQQSRLTGRDLRVSGQVIGDSILFTQIDSVTSRLEFDIMDSVREPGKTLHVVAMNEPMPDLLQHEAQAIVEGSADSDGVFHVNPGGLLLKCPTRYEEMAPTEN